MGARVATSVPQGPPQNPQLWLCGADCGKPEDGFEPTTYRLQGGCSGQLSYSGGNGECRRVCLQGWRAKRRLTEL